MTDVDYSKPMDFDRADIHGITRDITLIGKRFRHWKSQRVYEIVGFTWNGDTDEWMIRHCDVTENRFSAYPQSPPHPGYSYEFARSAHNFFDEVTRPRMTKWDGK